MKEQVFDTEAWHLAMTLSERLQAQARPDLCRNIGGTPNYRFHLWRSQPPFDADEVWSRRLALIGLADEEFLCLLSESASVVRSRFAEAPDWLITFQQVFTDFSWASGGLVPPTSTAKTETFTIIAGPLVRFGVRRLQQGISGILERFPCAPFDGDLASELRPEIVANLAPMLARTMALELNVARLEGSLAGETPEERFHSFVQNLADPQTALRILGEYPVLARQLTEGVIRSVDRSLEALERLCDDWEEIQTALFSGERPGRLVRLTGTSGDQHRGGRTVLFAEFESGDRIVYKPRSLAVEVHFQRLLAWIEHVQPVHVAGYIEQLQATHKATTVKQHLACNPHAVRLAGGWRCAWH